MKRTTFILSLLFLHSCQSVSDDRLASYEGERQAYFQCGYSAGKKLARRNSEPFYVVNAAKVACSDQRSAVVNKVMQAHNQTIWLDMIDILDRKFRESVSAGAVNA